MRFMILVKATAESEAGKMPSEKLLADMGKFNEELVKAGPAQVAVEEQAEIEEIRRRRGEEPGGGTGRGAAP